MTISTLYRNDYVGDGATSAYAFTFDIFVDSDLRVIRSDASGNETVLTLTDDYTVSITDPTPNSGTITLTAGNLTSGFGLSIERNRPFSQTTDLQNQSAFFPATHEDALDHAVMLARRAMSLAERAIRLREGANLSNFDMVLPEAVASRAIGWNATADEIVNLDNSVVTPTSIDSVNVPFLQSGSGANERSTRAKLREYISVTDFGATGDGVTDDITAIDEAISEAQSRGGGDIFFPVGTYLISAPIDLSATRDSEAIRIFGEGHGPWNDITSHSSTILNNANGHALVVRSTGHTIIENLGIQDNLTAVARTAGAGIYAERDTAGNVVLEVRNVYIENHIHGIQMVRPIVSKISRCIIATPELDGIRFESTASGSGTSTIVENCFINTPGQDGYAVDGMSYTSFIGCAVDSAGRYGYYVHGTNAISNGISFFGCGAENPTDHCMFLDDQANSVNAVLISGGLFSGSSQDGININMSDGVSIIGPKIQLNTGSGIEIQAGNYITIISPHFSTNTAGDITGAGLASALYIAAPNTGAFMLGHVTTTGLNAADIGLRNAGAIRWLNNAGTTSANYGLVGSGGDHVVYGVPGTGGQHLFQMAGTTRIRLEESSSRGVVRFGADGTFPAIFTGAGAPAIAAYRGSLYLRTDGGADTTLYVKEADDGLGTGWSAAVIS